MKSKTLILLLTLELIFLTLPTIVETSASPTREANIVTPYPRIKISEGKEIRLEVAIINEGDEGEVFNLEVSSPEGWHAILTRRGYEIKSIYLAPAESHSLDFIASPSSNLTPGNYTFQIKAQSTDKTVEATLGIQVDVVTETFVTSGITLGAAHPFLVGAAGMEYEFSVTVVNMEDERRVIEFSAVHPQNWLMTFKPPYEDKQIRSMAFDSLESKVIWVTVSPPSNVDPGNYSITVSATSGRIKENLGLNVTITGTYRLDLLTPDGLLSFGAIQGKETLIPLTIQNIGTGFLEDVHFSSSKPIGWDVIFEPDILSLINPGDSWEMRALIKPPPDTIPGDYSVILYSSAHPYETSDELTLRVTVRGSLSWGLVGLGIIVGIISLLIVIFWRMGRR